jgi:hypothetical protein
MHSKNLLTTSSYYKILDSVTKSVVLLLVPLGLLFSKRLLRAELSVTEFTTIITGYGVLL